jgi:hypothetical protein
MRVRYTILIIRIINILFSCSDDNRGKVGFAEWVMEGGELRFAMKPDNEKILETLKSKFNGH